MTGRPAHRWGSRWLATVESSTAIPSAALERGLSYAGYDWQLDVDIRPGAATTTARSGPRIRYDVTLHVPVLTDAQWSDLVTLIAERTDRTAALLDAELDDALLDDAEMRGVPLLPAPADISLSCSCRTTPAPCKHAAALVHLVADAIDEDPFDLLHLRGRDRSALIDQVQEQRSSTGDAETEVGSRSAEHADGVATSEEPPAGSLRLRGRATVPPPPKWRALPHEAAVMAPFPSDPPETAQFTADGLRLLGTDAAHRALELLRGRDDGALDLDPTADMARRALLVRNTDLWRSLVRNSGLSSQELSARAAAWERGGRAGLEAHVAPAQTIRPEGVDGVQWRRTRGSQWFVFERRGGRFELVSGPFDGPPTAPSDDVDGPFGPLP